MANEEERKAKVTPDISSLFSGLGFLTEEESKRIADLAFAPERERWKVRYDTLNALKDIANIQSQQSKTLSDLGKDTENNVRSQDRVNRILIWFTGSGLAVAVLSLLASIAIGLGLVRPLK